jgi:hypothetical protein
VQVQDEAEGAAAAELTAFHATSSAASKAAAAEDDGNDEAVLRRARASIGIGADEVEFQGLVPLEAQEYWWREKHKPRRPKFFNKVHTGVHPLPGTMHMLTNAISA